MNDVWRVLGIALFCACLAGCATSSALLDKEEAMPARTAVLGGSPSAEVLEPLFRITQPPGAAADALISHDFQVRNKGGAVLEIIKITPG